MVVLDSFPFLEESDGGPAVSSKSCTPDSGVQYSRETAGSVDISFSSSPYAEPRFDSKIHDPSVCGDQNSQGYFKCRLCHYQTKILSLLRRHVVKHSLDSDFRCPACDFRENDPGKFVDHIGTHQSGRMVRCCFCPRKMSRGKLKSHVQIHRPVELYDCSMCQFSTNYGKTIKRHMDLYHSKEYACNQCDMVMTKHELHWHMKFIHGSTETQYDQPPEQATPMSAHSGHGLNSTFPVKTSKSPNQSIFPRKLHNTSKISPKTSFALKTQKFAVSKKQFNCGKCDYRSSFKKLLRDHRAKHLLDNSLACSKCDFKETSTGKFATHLLGHSPEGVFECCFCGFQTPRQSIMSNHLCTHKPLSMFDCSECEFSARRPASLRVHTANVHRKKIRCGHCGIEVSNSGWRRHRIKCRRATRGDSVEVESASENQPGTNSLPGTPGECLNDNCVPCELCKKLYAKSYVRRHYKRCQGENAVDSEPNPVPDHVLESNDEQLLIGPMDRVESPGGHSLPGTAAEGLHDNLVPCELCKKLFAKSYVRRHYKRCHGENAVGLEPDPVPDHVPESNDEQLLIGHVDQVELPGGFVPNLLPRKSTLTKLKKPFLGCSSCFFKTKKKSLLKKHVQKHLIDFRLTCPECGHKEMSASRFARHIIQHGTNPKYFQCCFCPMSTSTSKRSHIAHLERHRPINIFDCSKCEYSSSRVDSLRLHWKTHHAKKSKCQHYGKVMNGVRLGKHLSEAHTHSNGMNKLGVEKSMADAEVPSSHLEQIKETLDPADSTDLPESSDAQLIENDKIILHCTECPFQTKIQSLMDRHAAKHLVDVPFVCPLCGFEHFSSRKFANHWDKHECNSEKKFYQCCFCDALIKKKNCLKGRLPQHIEDHRAVALQDCSECEFSSHNQYELSKHYKNQHVKKRECLVCREVMNIHEYSLHTDCKGDARNVEQPTNSEPIGLQPSISLITLRRQSAEAQSNLVVALNDPAFLVDSIADSFAATEIDECRPQVNVTKSLSCNSCNYKTQLRHLLIRHVQKHLIDVPFTCSICSFETFHERTFVGHIFGHTGSLGCHFCSFTAKSVSVASRHYVTHKVVAMHDCPKCEYTSTYKERTAEHLMGSHTNKPRCSYCGKWMSEDEIWSHEMECQKSLRTRLASLTVADEEIIKSNEVSASNELVPVQHCDDTAAAILRPDTDVSHLSGMQCDVTSPSQLDSVAELHSCNVALTDDSRSATEPKQESVIDGSIHSACSGEVVLGQEESSSVKHQHVPEIETVGSTINFSKTSPILFSMISPIMTIEAVRQYPPVVDSISEESPVESSDTVIDSVLPSADGLALCRELSFTACSKPVDGNPSTADPGLGIESVSSDAVFVSTGQNQPDKSSTTPGFECDPHKPQCPCPIRLPDELNLSSSPVFDNVSSRGGIRKSDLASANGDSCKHCGESLSIGHMTGTMGSETCAGSAIPLA